MKLVDRVRIETAVLADEHGLTKVQMIVLHLLEKHQPLAMGELAALLHCDASNVTGMVDRLLKQGLVVREAMPQDRRTKTLALTPKSRRIMDDIYAALPARLRCNALNANEREQLMGLLQKLL